MTMDSVAELETLARTDHAAVIARGAVALAETDDMAVRSRVNRLVANSHRARSELDEALQHYEAAIVDATAAGSPDLEGQARTSKAGAHSMAGQRDMAMVELDLAEELTTGLDQARVVFQRTVISQREYEDAEMLRRYERVIRVFREGGDREFLAHSLSNRGIVHVNVGDPDAAHRDFSAARDLYEDLGLTSTAAVAAHNLGWATAKKGDVPAALQLFDQAERTLIKAGRSVAAMYGSKSEALADVGLFGEALALSEQTATFLARSDRQADYAEALYSLAEIASAAGLYQRASEAADQAARLFKDQQRTRWHQRALLIGIEAAVGGGTTTQPMIGEALDLRDRLAEAGIVDGATKAAVAAARMLLAAGDDASSLDRYVVKARRSPRLADRLGYWDIRARQRMAAGNDGGASRAVSAGIAGLERAQSTLHTTDARVNVVRHAATLVSLGSSLSSDSSTRRLWEWWERTRFVDGWYPPARRVSRAEASRRTIDPTALGDVMQDRTLISYGMADGRYVAISLRHNRMRRIDLAPAIDLEREVGDVARSQRRFVVDPTVPRRRRFRNALRRASQLLYPGVEPDSVVIIPPASLMSFPWAALGAFEHSTVAVAPSASTWLRTATARRTTGSGVVVAGPELDGAVAECAVVQGHHPDWGSIAEQAASRSAVLSALGTVASAHIVAHGVTRYGNPLFSSVQLVDGDLHLYDFETLERLPSLMVLSACDVGRSDGSGAFPGSSPLGFVTALLGLGVTTVIASVAPVPDDDSTRGFMDTLHAGLAAGIGPAAALRAARVAHTDAPAAMSFGCYGAG